MLNHLRKLGRERLVFDVSVLVQLADVAAAKLQSLDRRREALEQCLKELPPPQRQLIEMRYAGGQSVDAMAESLRRPAGSLRQTLYRIRQALQACIEGQLAAGGEFS